MNSSFNNGHLTRHNLDNHLSTPAFVEPNDYSTRFEETQHLLIPCEECGYFHASDACFHTEGTIHHNVWLRLPNTAFGICLGLAGHAILWKAAAASDHCPVVMVDTAQLLNRVFWLSASLTYGVLGGAYLYKAVAHFDLVRDEYRHAGRVHFFNAPHLALVMLGLGSPTASLEERYQTLLRCLWWVGFAFQVGITQLVYERWLFSKRSNIASSAQPQFLLSTVGWFLLSNLGHVADIDVSLRNVPVTLYCLGAGLALYLIAVIAIINRLHLQELKAKGSPALTLLIAPPSVGVVALENLRAETAASLLFGWCWIVLLLLFKVGPRILDRPPSLGTYWAYVFPLAAFATASLRQPGLGWVTLPLASLGLVIVVTRMAIHVVESVQGTARWGDPLIVAKMAKEEERLLAERGGESPA